jgi:streptogramin lyase
MKGFLGAFAVVAFLGFGLGRLRAAEPALTIQTVGVNVLLEWPADSADAAYVLEGAGSLTPGIWDRVPGVVTNSTVLGPADHARYFRLNQVPAGGVVLRGTVQSGGTLTATPLPGVSVTLYQATTALPAVIDQTTADAAGRFELRSANVSTESIFFITAAVGSGMDLMAVLGPILPSTVTVNELTTVAASYSLAQFYRSGVVAGDSFGLRLAAGMNDNLVAITSGASSPVLLNSPNADESNSLRSTRALANLLSACIADPAVVTQFLGLTTEPGGSAPTRTSQAMANLARNPGLNVASIYALSTNRTSYLPTLEAPPDAWTVAVKVNDSGDDRYLIGGMGYVVFDAQGYAWITDNVVQGTNHSSRLLVVLQPNGKPAAGASGTPRSPIRNGGLLGGGYGLTIDPKGSVWVGNFGWGTETNCLYYPATNCTGSVSQFSPSGVAISGPAGYQGGPQRAQGMAADGAGNIWICSYGDDSVYVFLEGNPNNVAHHQAYQGSQPFDVEIAADGTAWVSCGGGIGGDYPARLQRLELVGNKINRLSEVEFGKATKGISLDSLGNVWVASQGDSKAYIVNPEGNQFVGFGSDTNSPWGGVNGPWGVTVDGEDNVWVADFGPLDTTPYSSRISKLAGANPATRPPGTKLGDPISPATGYTLPSAGSPVLLHNGTPLYGTNAPPAYEPLQRVTQIAIDRAGSLWALNNWKNKFIIDDKSNPGGDGVVIFVGLAPPFK